MQERKISYKLWAQDPKVDGISLTEWHWYVMMNDMIMDQGVEFKKRKAVKRIKHSITLVLKATL
ncbi:hypothetical protein FDI69_gp195 [Rhodococcus phage Trina]|uniref:Uncharacterized protein n=1 Tax=Rhodococcus phage Trina TaxID=2027905 RepID=A0A2D0ZN45_9CAUD|nr:hypothetical protein FDI69_gp195 [Rhodococcus phage Trina]ASZ74991.1 hypothetical protein SEA_TRINA_212 [Rhodococcus phage Trina]